MDDLLTDAVAQLLRDQSTPDAVRAIEAGGAHGTLWQASEDAGFAAALGPEAQGGAGLALHEVFGLLRLCGTHAVPVPLGETVLARGWLARAGVTVPRGRWPSQRPTIAKFSEGMHQKRFKATAHTSITAVAPTPIASASSQSICIAVTL